MPARAKAKPSKRTTGGGRFVVPKPDPATVALLEEALGGRSQLKAGSMFGCPGFFVDGKAVAVVFGHEVSLTLPPAEVERLTAPGPGSGFRPFEAMGKRMSGWVLVDPERLMRLGADAPLFDAAIACARGKAKKPARR